MNKSAKLYNFDNQMGVTIGENREGLTEEERASLTRLIGSISVHPSDAQITEIREPKGKVTESKLIFFKYELGIVIKIGKARGAVWQEISSYIRINKDPLLIPLQRYFPRFLGYIVGDNVDAFAIEDLKRKGHVELYDLLQAPSVTHRFKDASCRAVKAISEIHQKTISPEKPNLYDIYIRGRFEDSVQKAYTRIRKYQDDPDYQTLKKFLDSKKVRIDTDNVMSGLKLVLKEIQKPVLRLLVPTFSAFCHKDFHVKNVFDHPKGVKLIDLVNADYGQDPVYDIGKYIGFLINSYPLQLSRDENLGIKIEDFQLIYDTVRRPPTISYDIKSFTPRRISEVIRMVLDNHFIFSKDKGAPARLLLAVASATIGGIKYYEPKASLIFLCQTLKALDSLHEVVKERKMSDLDYCVDLLLNQ